MSRFTGRVEFEWVKYPSSSRGLETLCGGGIVMGQVWRAANPEPGGEWIHDYGIASTLEEAKAALLKALGIVVEWQEGEEVTE